MVASAEGRSSFQYSAFQYISLFHTLLSGYHSSIILATVVWAVIIKYFSLAEDFDSQQLHAPPLAASSYVG